MEIWKDVSGYEGFYEVSNIGNVRTVERIQESYGGRKWVKPSRLMKTTFDGRYMVVSLSKPGKRIRSYVHDLVMTAFVCPRQEGQHCCHCDGNGANNVLENLRWDTPSSNNQDKIAHGTIARGESHGMNKYSEEQVRKVKLLLTEGYNATEIEGLAGVHRVTVAAIRSGRQWKYLKA